ncbi:MAG: phage holin family protein [Actinobacteria bacterium]|nr:phage holin family protein [Actinomycetota bacterium]
MPDRPFRSSSFSTVLSELWEMVLAYVKQETLDPAKKLGRYVGWGLLGSLLLGMGMVLLALAGLRVLQDETGTTFHGNWSWAPYAIVLLGGGVIVTLLLSMTRKRKKGSS